MNLFFLFFLRSKIGELVREPSLLPPIMPGFESCGWSFSLPLPHPERFFCGSSAFPISHGICSCLSLFFSRATLHYLNSLCTDCMHPPPLPSGKIAHTPIFPEGRGGEGVCKEATIWTPETGCLRKDNLFKFQIDQEWQWTNNQLCVCACSKPLFIYSFMVIYFEDQRNYLEVHNSRVAFKKHGTVLGF